MRNITFVIWMLLWPIIIEIGPYLTYLKGEPKIEVNTLFAIIMVSWYCIVGYLLYEKKSNQHIEPTGFPGG